ncbi:hypothetical protein GSI_11985 [Ganoderma sinense ZZ0214-1]|uniref:DUF7702 domain-containing protein n=1 Tax=Ganoderma sinense ZZ0214-1 TaxID=1077348 RepID=A0A2G8RXJ1_9APHY|nr:hypothetical protein GSI_11985 [Ganoderma sinense ZZ0214-1]
MKLDQRGDIAVAEIALYIPILLLSIVLVLRHGAARRAGWTFFAMLSITRIVGGVTHVLSEQNPSNTILQTVFSIMESAGLSTLLIATLAFLSTVGQPTLEKHPAMCPRTFRILQLVGTAAIVLLIIGAVLVDGAQSSTTELGIAAILRHAGGILFAVLYALIVALTAFCWVHRAQVLPYRRKLLLAITASLPFLLIRVLFTLLGSFAPLPSSSDAAEGNMLPPISGSTSASDSPNPLQPFSATSGSWVVYLLMSVLAEYVVVLIYMFAGLRLPLKEDLVDFQKVGRHMHTVTVSQESLPQDRCDARPYNPAHYKV